MTEQRSDASCLTGDRAIHDKEEDRLGFRPVAAQIATSLVNHASRNGLVVGIQGAWGSGKSSLLFLIEDELGAAGEWNRPTVINFRPWVIGERDSLLPALFRELTVAIDRIYQARGDSSRANLTKAKDAAVAVRRFAKAIGRAGDLVQFAGDLSSLPPISLLGKGIKTAGGAFGGDKAVSLSASKDALVTALTELNETIVVTVDDIDRLEPGEAFEVLRLIRSVADFPNVVYVLCYDSNVLAESIQKIAGVKDGHRFLEKIIQLTVTVPSPEPFELRNWFSDEIKKIGTPSSEKGLERLREVINWDGGRRLKTPRAVISALDAIRFMWPTLQAEGADFADVIWLQLIKNDNFALYRWIESYVSSQSVIALSIGQVEKADREADAESLQKADTEAYFRSLYYRHHFAEHLPGVEADFDDDAVIPKIYQDVSKREEAASIAEKRLSSPDHYRLYFSLAVPSHTITKPEIDQFWEAVELDAESGGAALLQLYTQVVLGSFTKADLLLERLEAAEGGDLTPQRARSLACSLSNVMDEVYRARPFDRFWADTIWDRAQRLLPCLLRAVGVDRAEIVDQMFTHGRALEWLTSIFRRETFAHGRYGDQAKPEQERILTPEELDAATGAVLNRYSHLSFDELVNAIDAVSLLYAWRQGGDNAAPRDLVQQNIGSDEDLVSLLEAMRGLAASSGGRYYPLKKDSLEPFLDYNEARARTEAIASKEDKTPLVQRAKALVKDFKDGERL